MFIPYITSINNNSGYNPAFGTTNKFSIIKKLHLEPDELEKVSQISDEFIKVNEFVNSLNGILQKKFKTLYPGLVSGEKMKGFLFEDLLGEKGKRLQITRLNTRDGSDELLTFGLLNSENKNLLRYKINKNGDMFVMKEKASSVPVDTEVFSRWNLDAFLEEVKYLGLYTQNFKTVSRKFTGTETSNTMHKLLDDLVSVKKSEGIKAEVENVLKSFGDVISLFNINHWRDVAGIKQEYFGEFAQLRSKSMFFKSPDGLKIYSYTPSKSNTDNRVFKLMVCDKKGNANDGFLVFADGKVARIIPDALDCDFVRGRKMEFISDKDIQELKLQDALEVVNKGLNDFKTFIIDNRVKKVKKTIYSQNKTKNVNNSRIIKPKKENITEKTFVKQPQITTDVKNTMKPRKVKPAKEKFVHKNVSMPLNKFPAAGEHQNSVNLDNIVKPVVVKQKTMESYPLFSDINLTSVLGKLDNLFETPIEERSSHLVHEKLSSGRIFSGRVSFTASDGAQVTVSRVKSPRYVDFVYYSVKVQKGDINYVLNLDPESCLILESTHEGKVIIDKRQRVKHLSKKEFLEQNPKAEKLAVYLKELFDFKSEGEKKVIKSGLKMRGLTLKEREKEVLKALGQAPELSLDSFYKI